MRRFGDVFDDYMSIVRVRKRLTAFTSAYDQMSQYFPFIVGAPLYFLARSSSARWCRWRACVRPGQTRR